MSEELKPVFENETTTIPELTDEELTILTNKKEPPIDPKYMAKVKDTKKVNVSQRKSIKEMFE